MVITIDVPIDLFTNLLIHLFRNNRLTVGSIKTKITQRLTRQTF